MYAVEKETGVDSRRAQPVVRTLFANAVFIEAPLSCHSEGALATGESSNE
jgi:hypothetical protein